MPYVTVRWVGGTLTNVKLLISKLRNYTILNVGWLLANSKLATQNLKSNATKKKSISLNERYGGIKEMHECPAAVVIVDACEDKNAIKEARSLNIPVFAIADTNVDPTNINYVIPCQR